MSHLQMVSNLTMDAKEGPKFESHATSCAGVLAVPGADRGDDM